MSVCVWVLKPGKMIVSETYGAPVLLQIPAAPLPYGDLPLGGTVCCHELAWPPQASDLGVLSVRLWDVLARGFLVDKWPRWGGGGAHCIQD